MADENPYRPPSQSSGSGLGNEHVDYALRRLLEGVSPQFIKAELLSRGLSEGEVRAVMIQARRVFDDGSDRGSGRLSRMSWLIAGYGCMVIGIGLLIGNRTGFFRTFPFAGTVVFLFGGYLVRQRYAMDQ